MSIARDSSTAFVIDSLEQRLLLSQRVVAYFPEYRYSLFNRIDLGAVTQLNYFSVTALADGSISTVNANLGHLDTIVAAAHARNVAVSIVIDPGSAYTSIDSNTTALMDFVSNIRQFCADHSLDGIDLDWEPSNPTSTQVTNYGILINTLRSQSPNLLLSAAVNPEKRVVPLFAADKLDWIAAMGYDLDYADHAPFARSITDLEGWGSYLAGAGIGKTKLVLGMPFYGRAGTSWGDTHTALYADIVNAYASAHSGTFPDPSLDSVSANVDGILRTWYFNGINTIRAKTQYSIDHGFGGTMVWEVGQDHFNAGGAYDAPSLLPVIKSTAGTPQSPVATLAGATLSIAAAAGAGSTIYLNHSASSLNVLGVNGRCEFPAASISAIVFNRTADNDALNITGGVTAPLLFAGASGGNDTASVFWGGATFSGDAANAAVLVETGASLLLAASQHLGSLRINAGASASLAAGANRVLVTNGLTINGNGVLDLNDNDMVVDYSGSTVYWLITSWILSGRSGGDWTGTGLTSTAAHNASPRNTSLGFMEATDFQSLYGASATFDDEPLDSTAVIVKYTYYGDTDFNGRVNFDDYVRTDYGFNNHLSGWVNGNFNDDSSVTFDDYVLIDLAFNTQGSSLHRGPGQRRSR